ncbi:SusD/RagB family nutrient-binding outer membrane lipoprotein [Owenweeksia hongkongensis]|uniref:SusD/RagB family nutrient-binding outer membrane lipoprotein n=1 Tax=Owenweeksia hongkongensis TaxID=253245 RepID=UPI003A916CAA
MKAINKLKYIGIALLGFMLQSCEKDMEELASQNPNSPESLKSEWFLTSAEKEFMDNMWDEWINARTGMFYAQYWSATAYTEESRYRIRESVNRTFWRAFYSSLIDLEEAKSLAQQEEGTQNKIAIANIMKAWAFHVMSDQYGALPLMDALNPDILSPSYDSQEAVYDEILAMLETAVNNLDETGESYGSGDLIYGGDPTMWKKFANSLRLRVALRMADVNDAKASAVFTAVANDPSNIMGSNSDNALFPYQTANPNNNPINENAKTRTDFAVSETMVSYMDSLNDPRLAIYARPAVNTGTYIGLEYGLSNAQATAIPNDDISLPGEAVEAANAPGIYMLYSEVCFMMAEAHARGWGVTGSGPQWFEDGIRSSMEFWGVSDQAAIDSYVMEQGFNDGDWKNVIGTQKWLALYMQGLQGWYEFTRLDFKKVTGEDLIMLPAAGSMDPELSGIFPQRMTYPDEEYTLNEANVLGAAAELSSGDSKASKLWWDVF